MTISPTFSPTLSVAPTVSGKGACCGRSYEVNAQSAGHNNTTIRYTTSNSRGCSIFNCCVSKNVILARMRTVDLTKRWLSQAFDEAAVAKIMRKYGPKNEGDAMTDRMVENLTEVYRKNVGKQKGHRVTDSVVLNNEVLIEPDTSAAAPPQAQASRPERGDGVFVPYTPGTSGAAKKKDAPSASGAPAAAPTPSSGGYLQYSPAAPAAPPALTVPTGAPAVGAPEVQLTPVVPSGYKGSLADPEARSAVVNDRAKTPAAAPRHARTGSAMTNA